MSQLLTTQGKAYNRYMQEANAVGLDETYAKKVRAGEIDIQTIQDEELADKISKYQEYYDKAIDSTTSFMETAEKLYNLPLDKAATKIEKFSDAIDLLDKKLDNAIGSKSKNKLVDKQTKEEKKTLEAYKTASKEAAKNYKTAKKTLGKSSTLANSGVNAKEKKAIQKALKEGREISLSYFKVGSSGYNAAVKYNEALKANTKATYDLATAQEEYNSWLVEASKIKFDNIVDDYEKKAYDEHLRLQVEENKVKAEAEAKKANAAKQSSDSGSFELVGKSKTSNLELVGMSKASTASFERKERTPAFVKSGSITEDIFNNLKKLVFPGFKKGGMVSVDDIEKQVHKNGDSVLGSFNQGERILTPVQNEMFEKFIGKLPELNQMADVLQPMIDLPKLPELVPVRNMGNSDINIDFGGIVMNGVNDPKEFANQLVRSVQTVPKARKIIQSVSTDMLAGGGRLGSQSIR